jgi:endo-alpha-1,4-polygalactosaminidase (GH114 family)
MPESLLPIITTSVYLSARRRFYVLHLPGQPTDRSFQHLDAALTALHAAGYNTVVIDAGAYSLVGELVLSVEGARHDTPPTPENHSG